MFFVASKTIGFFANLSNVLMMLCLIGIILSFTRYRRVGFGLTAIVLLLDCILCILACRTCHTSTFGTAIPSMDSRGQGARRSNRAWRGHQRVGFVRTWCGRTRPRSRPVDRRSKSGAAVSGHANFVLWRNRGNFSLRRNRGRIGRSVLGERRRFQGPRLARRQISQYSRECPKQPSSDQPSTEREMVIGDLRSPHASCGGRLSANRISRRALSGGLDYSWA